MDLSNITQVKLEIYTPAEYIGALRDSLTALGACKIGSYDHVISWQETKGCWRPLEDSNPFQGEKGSVCTGEEVKRRYAARSDLFQKLKRSSGKSILMKNRL